MLIVFLIFEKAPHCRTVASSFSMAAIFPTALDVYCSIPYPSDTKHQFQCTKIMRFTTRRFIIPCNSSRPSPSDLAEFQTRSPPLSDQLKPLSDTTLSDHPNRTHFLKKPKSTWVNPTKPKPSVLTLQRQKRSPYSYNPQIRDLKHFAHKLEGCDSSEVAFREVLEENPLPITRENALLVLSSLRTWQKTLPFLNWIKTQNLFPLETIFYNVTMKSLRFGRQFEHIESLALEMIENGIELDNITYSTIITCAKRCNLFDKAVEWFERMYKTGLMPDEVTFSAILDVYAKLGKVGEVLSLYERGRASGWKPDSIAFAVLGKMYGEAGDYDGIRFVLQEMKSIGVPPDLVVYNTLLEAMGKARKPGLARSLFEEMVNSGITPNEKTLTALLKIYGKARWPRDALALWEQMRIKQWPMDLILYNTLLNMCADLGMEAEAERLFEEMKESKYGRPDSWSYTAMLNIYGSGGKVEKAMAVFEKMSEVGVELNVMGCTSLIQCLGKARRIDDLVSVFEVSMEKGVKPDDRLCGCLLHVMSCCKDEDETAKILACIEKAKPRLVIFIKLLKEEATDFNTVKEEFRVILNDTAVESRRPFCNCFIDLCRKENHHRRAHEIFYLGNMYGLYPGLHSKTADEWRLDVRSLSVGAAETAFEEWMESLSKIIGSKQALPKMFSANTGAGTHKFSQGLCSAFGSYIEKLAAPFWPSEEKAGFFVATREDLVTWVQSSNPSLAVTA